MAIGGSTFVILRYEGQDTAEQALARLVEIEDEGVIAIADAAVLVKGRRGKVKLRQTLSKCLPDGARRGEGRSG